MARKHRLLHEAEVTLRMRLDMSAGHVIPIFSFKVRYADHRKVDAGLAHHFMSTKIVFQTNSRTWLGTLAEIA
jgi:hypothetical protein